jgi:hypothetical protein
MVQGGECASLALETGQSIRIAREGGRQDLDGDIPRQAGVPGTVDLTHTARAED